MTATPSASDHILARVVTNNLNVRAGPGLEFFVLGQLNDGDEVPILGPARVGDDTWLAIPGVGWVFDNPDWLELDRQALRALTTHPRRVRSAVAPPHPADVRTGIAIIDEVIEAVLGGDLGAVMAQLRLTTIECTTEGVGRRPPCAEGVPEGTRVEVLPVENCGTGLVQPERVRELVQRWLAPFAQSASPQTLKLYAVTEGFVLDWDVRYAAVFVFDTSGEGRIAWIGPEGGVTVLGDGCGGAPAGEWLRVGVTSDSFVLPPTLPAPLEPAPAPPAPTPAGASSRIVFSSNRDGNTEIYVMNADGSGQTRLTTDARFDGSPAWSPDGTEIAFLSDRDFDREIYVMNADGSGQTRLFSSNAGSDESPAWSPDGTQIVFSSFGFHGSFYLIHVMNSDGSGLRRRLTTNAADEREPVWSPDGTQIAFSMLDSDSSNWAIYVINADGGGQTRLTTNAASSWEPAWSPDASQIAFSSTGDGNNWEIYVMNADGSNQTRLTTNSVADRRPTWSPDGAQIAFSSNRDGNLDIYVMNADGTGLTRLTFAAAGDAHPAWSPRAGLAERLGRERARSPAPATLRGRSASGFALGDLE